MIKFNKEILRDKIYACWMGKNIGGTMGTPYEGKRELLDIQGFATKPGEVLVNDDLDLQLVWLKAMQEVGPRLLDERVLGEYWLTYIHPHWNEYGICKSNLREGILPPMSGEVCNDTWRNSNGAWIRTEIWACLFPGAPDLAARYAFYDACVDHGYGEGTYAAIFVEAMESAAFVISDIRELISIGLSKIPADCRMARSINLLLREFDKGTDWKDTRNMLVEENADLGWFQAPANVSFAMLGLLYGNCDFKKSMILAINCGDDTDCTGATAGALLGIMHGTAGIPKDWSQYLGDQIAVGCLLHGHGHYPKTCTELTDEVMALLNITSYRTKDVYYNQLNAFNAPERAIFTDEPNDFSAVSAEHYRKECSALNDLFKRKRYSFSMSNVFCEVVVELDTTPYIKPGETLSGQISVINRMHGMYHYSLHWINEDGFTVTGDMNVHTETMWSAPSPLSTGRFTIHAPETVKASNRLVLEVSCTGRSMPLYIPVVLFG